MSYPMVPLGEVLRRSEEWVDLMPDRRYKRVTVRLWGKGVAERDEVSGAEIAAARQLAVRTGQFILSRIDARNGAFGLVPETLDGAVVSNDFPVFTPNAGRILPEFLGWMSKTEGFVDLCRAASEGTTNRVRLKEDRFLAMGVVLPSIPEQRRVVARIEELASKIDEARRLQADAGASAAALLDSVIRRIWARSVVWRVAPLRDLVRLVEGQVDPRLEPWADLPHINGDSIQSRTCTLLRYRSAREDGVMSGKYHFRPGTILYSKIRPYLRKAVQVPMEGVCSADIYAFDEVAKDLEPRYLMYSLIAPAFSAYADRISGRTRMPKLNQAQLLSYAFSYPPRTEQRRIVGRLDNLNGRLADLQAHQNDIGAELEAMLPAVLERAFRGAL